MNEEPDQSEIEQSYIRCQSHPDFMDVFYDAFVRSTPMIQEKFKDVEMINQKIMIQHSVLGMVLAHKNPLKKGLDSILKDTAKTHGEGGYNIQDKEYDYWKQALLNAVKICDNQCDDEILKSWSEVVDSGIDYLKRNRSTEP